MANFAIAYAGQFVAQPLASAARGVGDFFTTAAGVAKGALASAGSYLGAAEAFFSPDWGRLLYGEATSNLISEALSQTSDEGSPARLCLGPQCRTSGTIIWMGDLEQEVTTSAKGSAGAQSSAPTINQYRSMAIAYHYDPRIRIEAIDEIKAEGRTIYRGTQDVSLSSTALYVRRFERTEYDDATASTVVREVWMEVVSPAAGPDLQGFESGVDGTVSGFTNGGNNGTFRCMGVDVDTSSGVQIARFRNSNAVTEGPSGGAKTLSQKIPSKRSRYYDSISFYDGSPSQMPNELIEEHEEGNVPAWRGVAYCVIERLNVTEWSGHTPTMEFRVRESSQRSVASAISVLLERAGITYPQYDVSGVNGDLTGYVVTGPKRGVETLAPLLVAYDVTMREEAGRLVFFHRSAAATSDVLEAELGADEGDGGALDPIQWTDNDGSGSDLPRELQISFLDSGNSQQVGMQRVEYRGESSDAVERINLGTVVMSPAQARRRAMELLWSRVSNARRFTTTLPPNRIDVRVGDLISKDGATWLIVEHSRRPDGVLEITAAEEWTGTDWSHVSAQGAPVIDVVQEVPAEHVFFISDAAPLEDADWLTGKNGYYHGHAVADTAVLAPKARLLHGTTAANVTGRGNGYSIRVECVGGWAEDALADAPFEYVDRVNTATVRLLNGELETKTQAQVQNGENWCQLGREILGFETATYIGNSTYELTGLHRGLRGTNLRTGQHAVGDSFLLLDRDTIKRFDIQQGVLRDGDTVFRMSKEFGADTEDHEPIEGVFRAGAKRSMHPYPVKGQRDLSAATLTVIWTRRVPLNGSQLPNPYHRGSTTAIQILSGPGGSVLFEESVSLPNNQATSTQRAYTSAFLTTLGLTYTNSITFTLAEQENGILSDRYEVTV